MEPEYRISDRKSKENVLKMPILEKNILSFKVVVIRESNTIVFRKIENGGSYRRAQIIKGRIKCQV